MPFKEPVPNVEEPSLNVTVPVGIVALPVGPVTVAVNVTDWLCPDGFNEEATVVVEVKSAGGFTTWVSTLEVEPLKLELPT